MFLFTFILLYLNCKGFCEIYFFEEFNDETYTKRWIESTDKGIEQGKFQLGTGKYFGDYWTERGLQTSQNSKFYGISSKFDRHFNNENKSLVIQYQVKIEEPIQCGGGYIKLLGTDFDPKLFNGFTPYKIMFGPDICGTDKKIVHFILNYKDKYYMIKKNINCMEDKYSHLYTLVVNPNNTYSVLIDNKIVESGRLEDDFDLLPAKTIKDPNAVKPSDWIDNDKIDDPEDIKPVDWDERKTIPNISIARPDQWDDDADGIWEPPLIDNPNYQGLWRPKKIVNPLYKGPWIHPEINNPDYFEDPNLYLQTSIGGIGFDIWQVIAGTIFDNILITDDLSKAYEIGETSWRIAFEDQERAYQFEINHQRKQKEEFKKIAEENEKIEQNELEEEILNQPQVKPKSEL